MNDQELIDLYWARNEQAIRETGVKYGRLCASIARNILKNAQDCEECINDTYFALWNAIPAQRPSRFSVFIGRITRNLALKRFTYLSAAKRNPNAVLSLEELGDCVSGRDTVESEVEHRRVEQAIDAFLWAQSPEKRTIFIRRYWYFDSIPAIASRFGRTENHVSVILNRLRFSLHKYLTGRGFEL